MDIEIVIVGESNKWVLNQPRIRIGQDSRCEVSLPAAKYPAVLGEHATLDVADGTIKLVKGLRQGGDIFLNGQPAAVGATIRSGDLLRLGASGPELRLRVQEEEASTRSGEYQPTRVLYQPASAVRDSGSSRPSHEATRIISSGPVPTTYSPAPTQVPGRQGVHPVPSSPYTPSASINTRRIDTGANGGATQVISAPGGFGPARVQEIPTNQTAAARAAEGEMMQSLEGKLKSMQLILVANLAVLVLLFGWIYMQSRELTQTHREVQELKKQATNAVGALTPSLDARLNVFEKRMDVMDQRVSVAQDRMIKGMDEQAKLAEDRLANRMNAEIPAMLDKYVNKKMADLAAKKPPM
jgi:ribosomal 50S subunit-recycling heat shock protein